MILLRQREFYGDFTSDDALFAAARFNRSEMRWFWRDALASAVHELRQVGFARKGKRKLCVRLEP